MKNKYYAVFLLLIIVTAGSCKKWLDVRPETQVLQKDLLSNEQGFQDALTGVYMKMADSTLYGQSLTMTFLDVMAQRYNINTQSQAFYQASVYNYIDAGTKTNIADIWTNMYSAIGNANNILAYVDEKKSVFSGNNFAVIKGEALALRALLHFDLLRLFGASPVVDPQRKAIPYVTVFGVKVSPQLTVKAVADSCLRDLEAAAVLLGADKTVRRDFTDNPFISYTRNHMNYWSVKGLQARIQLYMSNTQAALTAAREVISNQAAWFPFVTNEAAAALYNRDRIYANEILFGPYCYKIVSYTDKYFKNTATAQPPLSITSKALGTLYETSTGGSSDIRFNYQYQSIAGAMSPAKYSVENVNSSAFWLINNIPVIRLSEVYYIAAECAPSIPEGVDYLNVIRKQRGIAALPGNISAANFQAEILKEYKKEFVAEGQLFYYFKRKNAAKIDGSSIAAGDRVYILPLPDNEIEFGGR
ncbi:MAG TPA: RagB/SusD family nutrient uptake outer membrane protein [Chitinophaga sp.]|uniref:RagB/SusD family nutrient uptake outer membrane protein n=1 Tax=Chitinophaga sp. TaxID=1869181 RepID=UPI002BD43ACC|nr:RagB/SusD family nutrient uptake outer membrane protein [Chitinophaga sp.]HVI48529.1 RagB/SusD family nutrient uptake outer membrane protein [Chitinophaga sp.]